MSFIDDVSAGVDTGLDKIGKLLDLNLQYQLSKQNAGLYDSRNQPWDYAQYPRNSNPQANAEKDATSVKTFGDWAKQNKLLAGVLALVAGGLAYRLLVK